MIKAAVEPHYECSRDDLSSLFRSEPRVGSVGGRSVDLADAKAIHYRRKTNRT